MKENKSWLERMYMMFDDKQAERLHNAHVLVVGLGGVGGVIAEMLARAGIGKLTIVDGDTIHHTNRNRQIIALQSSEGKSKVAAWEERLRDISPEIEIISIPEYIKDERMIEILDIGYDYVVDAIDTLSPKVYLIYHALNRNLPIVSSMGAGGKFRPELVTVSDISETNTCKLAMYIRKKLHKLGVFSGFHAVYSTEQVPREYVHICHGELNKKSTVGTISYMPTVFACHCVSVVIMGLLSR
jgi:tRNA A37 threonylcarbamoyladenosine dehydratase